MNVIVCKKGSNQNIGMRYKSWIEKYVNKGFAHEYEIMQYPNLVILTILDSDGYTIRQEAREYTEAKRLADTQPKDYKIKTFDIAELKQDHIKRSKSIYFGKSLSKFNPYRLIIACSNSSISYKSFLIHSIESSPWIRITKRRIKYAISISLILLGYIITLYIAHRQGVNLIK